MADSTSIIFLLIALIPVCGFISAITPWLMPRNECFAVTVPASAHRDPRIRTLKRRYLIIMVALTLACTAFAAAKAPQMLAKGEVAAFTACYTLAIILPIVVGFIVMLAFRKRVQFIKAAEGWTADQQLASAPVGEGDIPRPLSLSWNILYIPILLLTIALVLALYPSMPDEIPMQIDFNGNVARTAQKSIATALLPVFIQLFLGVCMAFSHWTIIKSKRPTDPEAPATSTYAYGAYTRAMTIILLASGLLLCATIGVSLPLASARIISIAHAGLATMAVALVIVIGSIVIAVVYGQNGSRLFKTMNAGDAIAHDDDRFWKLGVFYVNSKDEGFIVPKRFGVGWTVNFGSRKAWILIAAFTVVIAVFCWLVSLIG